MWPFFSFLNQLSVANVHHTVEYTIHGTFPILVHARVRYAIFSDSTNIHTSHPSKFDYFAMARALKGRMADWAVEMARALKSNLQT